MEEERFVIGYYDGGEQYYLNTKTNEVLDIFEVIDLLNSYYNLLKNLKKILKNKDKQNNEKAIRQLEKIKNYFFQGDCSLIDGCELGEFINNQIKELKEEMNYGKRKI